MKMIKYWIIFILLRWKHDYLSILEQIYYLQIFEKGTDVIELNSYSYIPVTDREKKNQVEQGLYPGLFVLVSFIF